MKTVVSENKRVVAPEFPKLMKDATSGDVYLMSARLSGTRIASGPKGNRVGIHKTNFTVDPMANLMDFVGTVTLGSE